MIKKKIDWRITCIALVCITFLETIAILQGIDGVLFGLALVAIAGIAGFKLKR